MHESSTEKYLGDIFNKSCKSKENIEARVAKGYVRVNTILAMLQEAPLGWTKIKAGLKLRKAMLINSVMFNSESWHGVTMSQVEDFEQVDQALLRGLADGHAKVSIPAIYLELGQEPIRYILAARRIMYLQTLLKRDNTEMTSKILRAQQADPIEGDFCLLVEEDMKMIKLEKSEEEIISMTKGQMKLVVKRKVKEAALKYLMGENKSKEKTKHIKYHKLEPKQYMIHPRITNKQASLLFALRTRTIRGIRGDFGQMYPNKQCPLDGCKHLDTLPGLLTCPALRTSVKDHNNSIRYEDVFSHRLEEQRAAAELFARLLETREELLSPPAT